MTPAAALRVALIEQLRDVCDLLDGDPAALEVHLHDARPHVAIEAAAALALRGSRAGVATMVGVQTCTNSQIEFFLAKAGLRLLGEEVPPALAARRSVFGALESLVAAPIELVVVRSTTNCSNTPRVLFALEEAGEPYRNEVVPDGWFTERFDVPGPSLEEGGRVVVEIGAVLRHIARAFGDGALLPRADDLGALAEMDRWLDFFGRRISRVLSPPDPRLRRLLARLDTHLEGRAWILGDFSIVDCTYGGLPAMRDRLPLDGLPRLSAYLDRLAARPALARGEKRVP